MKYLLSIPTFLLVYLIWASWENTEDISFGFFAYGLSRLFWAIDLGLNILESKLTKWSKTNIIHCITLPVKILLFWPEFRFIKRLSKINSNSKFEAEEIETCFYDKIIDKVFK